MFPIEEMNFPNDYFKDGDIYVLWNVEDYPPIPANAKENRKTSHNIISALRQLGSVGTIHLFSFDDDPQMERRSVLWDAGFYPIKPIGYKRGERTMLETMIGFLISYRNIEPRKRRKKFDDEPEHPPIYVVIAKDTQDGELYRTLSCLKHRGIQIVLLKPAGDYYMFPSVHSVMERGQMLDGEELISISKHPDGFGEMDWDYNHNPSSRSHCSWTDFLAGIESINSKV